MQPDHVIVDHLAFSARLALLAGDVPHADVVLGHPSALPVGDEVYGYPPAWPKVFDPDPGALAALLQRCRQVRDDFTAQWNAALKALAPQATPAADAFTEHSELVLLNYPGQLHDPARTAQLPPHAFLGSAVRAQSLPAESARLARRRPGPAAGLCQLRQFPVRARGCALPGRLRAAVAAGAGGAGDRLRRPGSAGRACPRTGWCGNSCRRSPCSSTRR